MNKHFTLTDADLLFAKVKVKGQRKIQFGQFLTALQTMAEKQRISIRQLEQKILEIGGPLREQAVFSDPVLDRLTDTSLYTGSHRERFDADGKGRGLAGRDVDPGSVGMVTEQLGILCNRTPSDVRGLPYTADRMRANPLGSTHSSTRSSCHSVTRSSSPSRTLSPRSVRPNSAQVSSPSRRRSSSATRSRTDGRRRSLDLNKSAQSLSQSPSQQHLGVDDIFVAFASFGMGGELQTEMDGAKFAKLCRDCDLVDKNFTSVDVDLAFTKAKTKGQRRISFAEFHDILQAMADKKGVHKSSVINTILRAEGPVILSAVSDQARMGSVLQRLTDHTRYTGSHKFRFDQEGHGRGLNGRDAVGPVGMVTDKLGQMCERKGLSGVVATIASDSN